MRLEVDLGNKQDDGQDVSKKQWDLIACMIRQTLEDLDITPVGQIKIRSDAVVI